MKKTALSTLSFIFLIAGMAIAQPRFNLYPDSIRVEMPDQRALVVFQFREITQSIPYLRNFSNTFRELLDHVKTSQGGNLQNSPPLRVDVSIGPEGTKEIGLGMKPFGEKTLVTIEPASPSQTSLTILSGKGVVEMLPPGWVVNFNAKEYRVKVYGADLAALEGVAAHDFGGLADAISQDEGMKTIGRKSVDAQFRVRNSTIEKKQVNYVFPGDNIGLGFQGGIGLVQNIVYPELSLKLWLTFKDRFRRPNFRTSIVGNHLFFTEQTTEGFTTQGNTFLSGTFEVNFNKKSGPASWSGLGIGFLTYRNGNYFKGNTAKFFITHTIPGSRFSMVPEFYLTNDFKQFTFGMTLKYSF